MTKEQIRDQLTVEIQALLQKEEYQRKNVNGIQALRELSSHLKQGKDFSHVITDTLNEILKKNDVSFETEEEKSALIQFLKPTVADLMRQYIKN